LNTQRAAADRDEPAGQPERLFSGLIGTEYQMLDLICPAVADISRRVGDFAASLPLDAAGRGVPLSVFEIGCGTGRTTLELLKSRADCVITSADNEPAMLSQARKNLGTFIGEGRVRLIEADALSALQELAAGSQDLVASAYTVHNFLEGYRERVLAEIFRVLRPGGIFINGDRYALDDTIAHTQLIQEEVRGYFKVFPAIGRVDLLEQWVVHLFSDESPDHIMRLRPSVDKMREIGFDPVEVRFRDGVNTLLTAAKPAG
jgi:ubiquinone/menaquinone biosynthesis C-methylase UbiE